MIGNYRPLADGEAGRQARFIICTSTVVTTRQGSLVGFSVTGNRQLVLARRIGRLYRIT